MGIKYSYKSYKESKVATAISLIGGFFNAIGKVIIVVLLVELLEAALGLTKTEKTNLHICDLF